VRLRKLLFGLLCLSERQLNPARKRDRLDSVEQPGCGPGRQQRDKQANRQQSGDPSGLLDLEVIVVEPPDDDEDQADNQYANNHREPGLHAATVVGSL
jgi:hypothetical protein